MCSPCSILTNVCSCITKCQLFWVVYIPHVLDPVYAPPQGHSNLSSHGSKSPAPFALSSGISNGRNSLWGQTESLSVCLTLCYPMGCSLPDSSPWNSPGENTGVSSHFLLQGIFPTQGVEPRSPTLQTDSFPSEPAGRPKNTGMRSLSFLRGSSWPRDRTCVFCTSGRFFTSWTTREGQRLG